VLAVGEGSYGTMSVEVPSSVTVRIAGRPSSVKVIIMDAPPTVYRWMAGFPVSPCIVIVAAELGPSGPYSDTPAKPLAPSSISPPSSTAVRFPRLSTSSIRLVRIKLSFIPFFTSVREFERLQTVSLGTWVDKGKGKGRDFL
jgi:hypothetical protein